MNLVREKDTRIMTVRSRLKMKEQSSNLFLTRVEQIAIFSNGNPQNRPTPGYLRCLRKLEEKCILWGSWTPTTSTNSDAIKAPTYISRASADFRRQKRRAILVAVKPRPYGVVTLIHNLSSVLWELAVLWAVREQEWRCRKGKSRN